MQALIAVLDRTKVRIASRRALTLFEAILVVIVLGILGTVFLPSLLGARNSTRDADAKAAIDATHQTLQKYWTERETFVGFDQTFLQTEERDLSLGLTNTVTPATQTTARRLYVGGADGTSPLTGLTANAATVCGIAPKGKYAFCLRINKSNTAGTPSVSYARSAPKDDPTIADAISAGFTETAF
ncbi:hypothetical protein GKE82_23910 [Conexibacter sp. W3-3-2]|uniref:type II secretion system protein n=1 Tax=Conexibacter sp. W3-3-2 TaxID=2675227 RepID=UPI0012B6B443|nr:hypothetical protein [Conexibacter sp. W3-3-2]MTD47253.1 hypothetical protein [Conexibacter sp. W3-3-2]